MHKLGSFTAIEGGDTKEVLVFEDALVVVSPSALSRAGYAFGGIGGMVSGMANRKSLQKKQASIDELGDASAEEIATSIKGAQLVRASEIAKARIEKGFGKARKLVLSRVSEKDRTFRFAERQQSPADLVRLLTPMLGNRVENGLA